MDDLLDSQSRSVTEMANTAFCLDDNFLATCSDAIGQRKLGDQMSFLATLPVSNEIISTGRSMTFTRMEVINANLVFNYRDLAIFRATNGNH